MIIQTFGYFGLNPHQIIDLVREKEGTLVDIRFSPTSRDPRLRMSWLQKQLGPRYVHVQELGNSNFKGNTIEIANFDAGLQRLETIAVKQPGPLMLMCACKHYRHCHRYTVAKLLLDRGILSEELQL